MTNSMTAFSSSRDQQPWGTLVWELRSVNHRYLDLTIKLPDEFHGLENELRERLGKLIKRGKLECCLRFEPASGQSADIHINDEYADAVLKACQRISKKLHQPSELNVIDILKWPGVIEQPQTDLKPIQDAALTLFDQALEDLAAIRQREGQRLQRMIEERCEGVRTIVQAERKRRPQILQQTRDRLMKKLEELNASYDKDRFEQELAFIAQKMDVDEELDRLESHFVEIEDIFSRNEPVGRRLDFIMQELNREANTLGSKSTDMETTRASVELKVLIEQMREQIQNIE